MTCSCLRPLFDDFLELSERSGVEGWSQHWEDYAVEDKDWIGETPDPDYYTLCASRLRFLVHAPVIILTIFHDYWNQFGTIGPRLCIQT